MNEEQFIDRLFTKRPLAFLTVRDDYLLRNGTKGSGGFESIGTTTEKAPLLLADYLSYDEMQIAALFGVSTPTYFINNGARDNAAQPGKPGSYEEQGIYTGLVGGRFEKEMLMEWQHMIVNPKQNILDKSYGLKESLGNRWTMWQSFYSERFATFEEAQKDTSGRFAKLSGGNYLDTVIYKKRMQMVLEPFLLDAQARGTAQNKQVYCHAVGLGLGVWQIDPIQAKLMLEVYADIIKNNDLSMISDLDFSWFPEKYASCKGVSNGQVFKTDKNNIKIHFSKRNPADKLTGDNANKLLVAMYAWDGNAYPGNEYWLGELTASGDPAAACCSTIPELQNPLINSNISSKNIRYYSTK